MPRPNFSRTITNLLATRGRAPQKAAKTAVLSDSGVESPSTSTTATDTANLSESSKASSSSALAVNQSSAETVALTPLSEFTVASLLLGPRPLPAFNFDSDGGKFIIQRAQEVGIPPADMLEHMVAWAYRVRANMGTYTLEDLATFYRDNKPEWWIG